VATYAAAVRSIRAVLRCTLPVILLVGASMLSPAAAEPTRALTAPSSAARVLVAFHDGTSRAASAAAHHRAGARAESSLESAGVHVVSVSDAAAALASYASAPSVAYAELDRRLHALERPRDNGYPLQWNLAPAGPANLAGLNWEPVHPTSAGAGVLVAVIDTGVRAGGFDGVPVRADLGWSFAAEPDQREALDDNGHGTHVAGTIAQSTGNASTAGPSGLSVAGVAPGAEIIPIKILDANGNGLVSDAVLGIAHALAVGADVINLSLGGGYSRSLCETVERASLSAIVVVAAGNESEAGLAPVSYPAACKGAFAVGGLRHDGSRGPYSNVGCEVAAAGPGGDLGAGRIHPDGDARNGILQETWMPDARRFGFLYDSGTSMAAAHAAGAAAVLLAIEPDRALVLRALRATARDLGRAGADDSFGAGALDVGAAAAALRTGAVATPDQVGYWMVASDGGIFSFGAAPFYGSTGSMVLNQPVVGMGRHPEGDGYWLVAADGGLFTFAAPGVPDRFFGSTGDLRLNRPVVGMASTPSGNGYWLVASDGGVFAFGDAPFLGSAADGRPRPPVVGITAARDGNGYWLVTAGGDVFGFGAGAPFTGSLTGVPLASPIVSLTRSASSGGYWLTGANGAVHSFGDAAFHGSPEGTAFRRPVVGMARTCYGGGYWAVASDGGVFSFGTATFLGSTGDLRLNRPVVGVAVAIDHRTGWR